MQTPCNNAYRGMTAYMKDTQLEVHGQASSREPQYHTYGNARNRRDIFSIYFMLDLSSCFSSLETVKGK